MNLQNYYWYFKSVIPERICDDIVRYGNQMQDQLGVTGEFREKPLNKKNIKDLKKTRHSNIVWMSDQWIYKEIQPYIHNANRNSEWNFDWDFSETCQFIGIMIVGIHLIKQKILIILKMVKYENYR